MCKKNRKREDGYSTTLYIEVQCGNINIRSSLESYKSTIFFFFVGVSYHSTGNAASPTAREVKMSICWLLGWALDLSSLVRYLMPNFHTHTNPCAYIWMYIYIYICTSNSFSVTLLNERSFICLLTAKWYPVLLSIVFTQLNGFKYCYLSLVFK